MILPPLPETHLNNKVDKFYVAADMRFYGEACIAAYKASASKRQGNRKFNDDQVCEIRKLYAQHHYPYKQVYRLYQMSEVTFINIVKRRGAYK